MAVRSESERLFGVETAFVNVDVPKVDVGKAHEPLVVLELSKPDVLIGQCAAEMKLDVAFESDVPTQ